jgi:16S rRNA (cytosine967-C5)-methyltransferase
MKQPSKDKAGSARAAALEALLRLGSEGQFLRDVLHDVFERSDLPLRDRALATQLATGVVRHRRTLRLVISRVRGPGRRATAIQPELLAILELGAFQLLFLDRVPAYAAVNEAAEAARRTAPTANAARKAAGFVNGVLRGIGRIVIGHDPGGAVSPSALPHPDGGVVRLREPVLPGPEADRAAFLGEAYSYPDWLVARWVDHFGGAAEEICRWGNRRPHVIARANPMKTTAEDLAARLAEESVEVTAGPRPGTLDLESLAPERLTRLIGEGLLTVQDPSAMEAVEVLSPKAGETVLDLCASPGTKTTQIVEAMGDSGRVLACDRSLEKLQTIRRLVEERGIRSVETCLSIEADTRAPEGGFSAALVDAPCSNTGVLARRVEARWRVWPEHLAELAALGLGLLSQAAALVRPGGRAVYSTCSLEPEENEGVVRAFLGRHGGWRLQEQRQVLPGPDHDGAFAALLIRRG